MNGEVRFLPSGKTVKVLRGTTLLDAARLAGLSIRTRCGGKAACFMCKMTVSPESELLPISDNERRKLSGLEERHIRLACQARVGGCVSAEVPLDPLRAAVERQLARQAEEEGDKLW
ncbi:2Fe-2S iron-sulfur cluster-binding protein [Paenibacillus sp. NEAU-GSW1]|uniref:2Fe-2S iron-sulfur cluster-binding protein n=1 Tax=Paenibacillus sp. NEAU-GSW1 TaxID=2682486 RepID=UPI0012E25274|nr:2Fe-2S iron-sulfur cluster-binding protein [Paenibacillus sp. NEAU-GSW1]MUT65493.1 2Fe-2S iron-sulfur cluster binding domain-containing protein [Paenibacillus sp. NEAU-GSW1]